jgi:hypothetical protein
VLNGKVGRSAWCTWSPSCAAWPVFKKLHGKLSRSFTSSQIRKRKSFLIIFLTAVDSIDYRCDDEKKNSWVGATSWYHGVADKSRIPK